MRFAMMIAAATTSGALTAGGLQAVFPQTKQMFQAMVALGGDPSQFKIDISKLNPVKAYQDVARQISSGELSRRDWLPQAPSFKPVTIDPNSLHPQLKIDEAAIQRAIGAGINSQISQGIRRTEDMAAYTRNPMAWHGIPPH
jgi:hypothetical protein